MTDAVEPTAVITHPAPDTSPSLARTLAAVALADTLKDQVTGRARDLRDEAGKLFAQQYDDDGTVKLAVRIPGVQEPVCEAILNIPDPVGSVTGPDAFTDFVAAHYPTEVQRTITVTVPEGFGADAVQEAILEAVRPFTENGAAFIETCRGVRPAFQTAFLKAKDRIKRLKRVTQTEDGGKATESYHAVVDVNPATGEEFEVPGTSVTTAAPTVFTLRNLKRNAPVIMSAVREQGDSVLATIGATPALTAGEPADPQA